MNATRWNYFVPYEADISSALQHLREDVFARGDYKTFADLAVPAGFEISTLGSRSKPGSIRELLDQQAGAGTHSILDITQLSSKPAVDAISPLPHSELARCVGSTAPSHAEIEEAYQCGLLERHVSRRGRGVYIIAYRHQSPDEFFFAGCSGTLAATTIRLPLNHGGLNPPCPALVES